MKKQGVILSVYAILIFLVAGCAAPPSPSFNFHTKAVINERENGWYYCSQYSYEDTSNSGPSYYSAFAYNAYNLKYKHIDGYDIPIVDKDTGEVVDYAKTSLPYLSLNPEATSDITNISSYFEGKRLGTSIDMSDLDGLELTYFNKQDFLEIVNNTLAQEPQPMANMGRCRKRIFFKKIPPSTATGGRSAISAATATFWPRASSCCMKGIPIYPIWWPTAKPRRSSARFMRRPSSWKRLYWKNSPFCWRPLPHNCMA